MVSQSTDSGGTKGGYQRPKRRARGKATPRKAPLSMAQRAERLASKKLQRSAEKQWELKQKIKKAKARARTIPA